MEPEEHGIHCHYCHIRVTSIYNKNLKNNLQKISDNIKIEKIQGEVLKSSVHML